MLKRAYGQIKFIKAMYECEHHKDIAVSSLMTYDGYLLYRKSSNGLAFHWNRLRPIFHHTNVRDQLKELIDKYSVISQCHRLTFNTQRMCSLWLQWQWRRRRQRRWWWWWWDVRWLCFAYNNLFHYNAMTKNWKLIDVCSMKLITSSQAYNLASPKRKKE